MRIKEIVVSIALICCFLGTTAQAAMTVQSKVETKTGVRFHGENPNVSPSQPDNPNHQNNPSNPESGSGGGQKDHLPQTGEVISSVVYGIAGGVLVVIGCIGYYVNNKKNKSKDVS